MEHRHVAVWLDHESARLFALTFDKSEGWKVRSAHHHVHRHHKAGLGDAGRAPVDADYFDRLAASLADAGEILIFGPSTAKSEFVAFLHARHPAIAKRVVGVETLDHPSDGEFVGHARKHFRTVGLMRGEVPF
ncbi:MAG TPA: translational machinery protein [Bauldia sp.]|nr:translational machinery protein [Bauldia sp.]